MIHCWGWKEGGFEGDSVIVGTGYEGMIVFNGMARLAWSFFQRSLDEAKSSGLAFEHLENRGRRSMQFACKLK